jgi:septal ring factor EnvC (AmiA/AmiB activator)
LSSSVKFDFPLDEVLIRQTTTMPNGIPFSQMTTEHTRRLFEFVDSSEEEELARRQFVASSEEEEELRREKFEEELEDTLASLNFFQEQCSELKNERNELKQKNKELEEELLYYQMCVYSMDPRARYCSPAKEDVDGFTECPQQRKILYERIGYESESDDEE